MNSKRWTPEPSVFDQTAGDEGRKGGPSKKKSDQSCDRGFTSGGKL